MRKLSAGFLFLFLVSCTWAPSKAKKISFMVWGAATENEIWNRIIKRFEQLYPDIKVKLLLVSQGYDEKLQTMLASQTAPDVFYLVYEEIPAYAEKNALYPLDSLVKKDKDIDLDDFYPAALKMFTYKGRLWGLPKDLHTLAVYYNIDLFEEYGIRTDFENWDWKEFLRVAKLLTRDKDGDGRIDTFGVVPTSLHFVEVCIWQNKGNILRNNRCCVDEPEAVEAIKWLADLIFKWHVAPTVAEMADMQDEGLFRTGRLGMYISGVWAGASFRKTAKFRWNVAPLPRGKTRANIVLGSGPVIWSRTKHLEEAYLFAKFITGPEGERIYSELGVSIPTRKSVAESPAFLNPEIPPENDKCFLDQLEYAHVIPQTPYWPRIKGILISNLENVWIGKEDVYTVCKTIASEVNHVLSGR